MQGNQRCGEEAPSPFQLMRQISDLQFMARSHTCEKKNNKIYYFQFYYIYGTVFVMITLIITKVFMK